MDASEIIRSTSQAMLICLLASLPAILASAVIGLAVAFFQAVTSLQDASISHAIKLLIVSAVIGVSAPWSGSILVEFSENLFETAFRHA